jgi:archaemetzincin
MSPQPVLALVALDAVDPEILRHLSTAIADLLSLPVRILPSKSLPGHTYHGERNQHYSTQLLEYLLGCEDHCEPFRVLGITAVDLYIPIFTFVFGEAQLDGKTAIISTFRPRGEPGGVKTPRAVLLDRLLKLSLHELGHTFGLPHCRREGCLMKFAANLEQLDRHKLEFCEYCRILLADYFSRNGL